MVDMSVLNEPEILNNIALRYGADQIFTHIGPTMIVINPYKKLAGLFSTQVMRNL